MQAQTLRMFTALHLLRPTWAGSLVLGIGLKGPGQALALASLAAGAAGLFLEEDPTTLRTAQRNGCCTFVVTTLDEALRALKNEIRQGRAITVGLSGTWLGEIEERGVLPAVIAAETPHDLRQLIACGASPVHGLGLAPLSDASIDLDALMEEATKHRWVLHDDVAPSLKQRHAHDVELIQGYGAGDPIAEAMRHWLRAAPSLFPRDPVRSHWVSTE